jgi:hypothetical protein
MTVKGDIGVSQVNVNEPAPPAQPTPPVTDGSGYGFIVGIIVAILVIVLLVWLLVFNGGGGTTTPTTVPSVSLLTFRL